MSTGDIVPVEHDRAHATAEVGEGSRILNEPDEAGAPSLPTLPRIPDEPVYRIAVPLDIEAVQAADIKLAARWRESTRRTILWGLEHGYRVHGFYRDDDDGCGFYVLTAAPRGRSAASPPPLRVPYGDDAA
jgi:predicted GNAT superfamily acetyltransferase